MRESTDKEGGREDVGRSEKGEGRGMRHDVEKTSGRGAGFVARTMDHEPHKSPFHGIEHRESTRREDGKRGEHKMMEHRGERREARREREKY